MATNTKARSEVKYDAKTALYAYVGAGQLLIDKVKELPTKANRARWQKNATRTYHDLAKRGEKLVGSIRRSEYTQRALDQAKTAQTQVKAARTSVRKAVGSTRQATMAAAKKVG